MNHRILLGLSTALLLSAAMAGCPSYDITPKDNATATGASSGEAGSGHGGSTSSGDGGGAVSASGAGGGEGGAGGQGGNGQGGVGAAGGSSGDGGAGGAGGQGGGGEVSPCMEPCSSGLTCCGPNFCTDTDLNSAHCGGCGNKCPLGFKCSAGNCTLL